MRDVERVLNTSFVCPDELRKLATATAYLRRPAPHVLVDSWTRGFWSDATAEMVSTFASSSKWPSVASGSNLPSDHSTVSNRVGVPRPPAPPSPSPPPPRYIDASVPLPHTINVLFGYLAAAWAGA